jgi:hypothetical protein
MQLSPSWENTRHSATKEFPNILWNPKIHYQVHMNLPLAIIVSRINPVLTTLSSASPTYVYVFILVSVKVSICQYHIEPPGRRAASYRLFATAYLIYSQLHSVTGGCLLRQHAMLS